MFGDSFYFHLDTYSWYLSIFCSFVTQHPLKDAPCFAHRSDLDTHHHPEVLQVLELGEVFLQFRVNGLVLYLRIFQEGPELLQPIQLTWKPAQRWFSRNSQFIQSTRRFCIFSEYFHLLLGVWEHKIWVKNPFESDLLILKNTFCLKAKQWLLVLYSCLCFE